MLAKCAAFSPYLYVPKTNWRSDWFCRFQNGVLSHRCCTGFLRNEFFFILGFWKRGLSNVQRFPHIYMCQKLTGGAIFFVGFKMDFCLIAVAPGFWGSRV